MKAEGEHSNIKNVIENTEGAMKNEQSGETSNKTKKNKTKARIICAGHHYSQTNTNNAITFRTTILAIV